jgi:DNA-directed RNA polymerase subunit RPC12/RpoP
MALKQIVCPECGKRLLLEVDEEGREYRCPVCGALFRAIWQNDALAVVFVRDEEVGASPKSR